MRNRILFDFLVGGGNFYSPDFSLLFQGTTATGKSYKCTQDGFC